MIAHSSPADVHDGAAEPVRASPQRSPRNAGRWVVLTMLLLLAVVLVCAALLVRDALVAREALTRAAAQVPVVEQALRAQVGGAALGLATGSDDDASSATPMADSPELAELRYQTAVARHATDGPLWWLAARAPVVGASAHAASTIAVMLDEITDEVLPPLAQVADATIGLERDSSGRVDLSPLQEAAPGAAGAVRAMDRTQSLLLSIDTDALLPQLAEPVDALRDRADELASAAATADRAATLAPGLLGADGPRTYLMLSVNPAELRAGGGIPGALILLQADAGRLEVVRQVASNKVGPFATPVLELSDDDEQATTTRLGRYVQDVTATPDFPTTARLAAEMWARGQGEQVDGVLSADPVALAFLLRATGPVEVPVSDQVAAELGKGTITLTADNAIDVLLRRAYDVLEPATADLFYADVAGTVLARATSENVSPARLMAALQLAAGEHRVGLWSAHDDEQERLDGTLASGTFADSPRAADAVGVFLADNVSGKMSAYLDAALTHVDSTCTPDGRTDVLELRLASTAPKDAATALPAYVAGKSGRTHRPGTLSLTVTVMGPRGGTTPRLERDGSAFGGAERSWYDRATAATTVVLDPGSGTTLRIEVPAAPTGPHPGAGPAGQLDVWSTPTTTLSGLRTVAVPRCD